MIGKIIDHPAIVRGLISVGILLSLFSVAIMSSQYAEKVKAASCIGQPAVNGLNGEAIHWRLQEWMAFTDTSQNPPRQIPIGSSRWTVENHYKNGGQDYCFVEDWKVQKVVFQSSRDNNRGTIIDANNAGANGINFSVPSVTGPKDKKVKRSGGPWYCGGVPDSDWGHQRFPQCFTDSFSHFAELAFDIVPSGVDPSRDPTTERWSPLGQYGLLFTNANNLTPARGYLPVEWLISGR